MQNYYLIDGIKIHQPDEEMAWNFETTYTEDTTRDMSGVLHETSLFTVEQLSYKATRVPMREVSQILKLIVGRRFTVHYFSPYFGCWRDDVFYVGKGSLSIKTVKDSKENMKDVSFNLQGVNPL